MSNKVVGVVAAGVLWAFVGTTRQAWTQQEAYRIEKGDLVEVRVYQNADLSVTFRVPPEGVVDYPLIGELRVVNRESRDVKDELERRLKDGYLRNPNVTCFVREYARRDVYVLGAVRSPGTISFSPEQPLTLTRALTLAGGAKSEARLHRVRVVRYPQEEPALEVDMSPFAEGNVPATDPVLRTWDVVFVPGEGAEVYLLGAVGKSGAFPAPGVKPLYLSQLIAQAGGFGKFASHSIVILRKEGGSTKRIEVDFDEIFEGDASADFVLQAGDVVHVPTRGF